MHMGMQEPGEMGCCCARKTVRLLQKKRWKRSADRKRL
jgi:hypothetical protein